MPQALLTNVAGANGGSGGLGYSTGPVIQDVVATSAAAIPFGTLVAVQTIVQATTTSFAVAAAATTSTLNQINIGIAVSGAQDSGTGSSIAASGTGQIVIHGHCRALFTSQANSTSGHTIALGNVAGQLTDNGTTLAAGVNYGAVLETLTISSNGTLVNIWFEKT